MSAYAMIIVTMTDKCLDNNPKVRWLEITEENKDQRLDNFLITQLKGVPKTRIYRSIRKGEVRVNKGRIDNKYRLAIGDNVRIPPLRTAIQGVATNPSVVLTDHLEKDVLYEDESLIVLNKPAGFAVHGGSGIHAGVIETLRLLRPHAPFLELAHRLDKETSGCLLIAKKRVALKALHVLFRHNGIHKIYLALLVGEWQQKNQWITVPLLRSTNPAGERLVKANQDGKLASTYFKRIQQYQAFTLVEASPKTGRTHQIRVHATCLGHPIVGDNRYGDEVANNNLRRKGYKRLFLHAEQLKFAHPITGKMMYFKAPLAADLQKQLATI